MNKLELISAIAEKTGAKKVEAAKFLEAYIDVVKDTLIGGNSITVIGFGSFEVKERAAKVGINPKTKQAINIAACKVPTFKISKVLKDAVK